MRIQSVNLKCSAFRGEKTSNLVQSIKGKTETFKSGIEIYDAFKICENKRVLNLKERFADGLPQHNLKIFKSSSKCFSYTLCIIATSSTPLTE